MIFNSLFLTGGNCQFRDSYRETDMDTLLRIDCPDNDVIRVGDTYYMVSTTMYFMPGCEIMRSKDLLNWEHAAYVYDRLDSTPAQRLENGQNIYGKGMWAASLRFHDGIFYICFVANDTHKTYLYKSDNIEGPWKKQTIEGFYHDSSLLFDDDGRIYIAYGNRDIYITELREDLTGPKPGGLNRLAVSDTRTTMLGYEGTHFYKINGIYYLFFIHSVEGRWFRAEACFMSDSIDGEFSGGEIFCEDAGYFGSGIAQGAIVDTPEGDWYAMLFQDRGASGRIPYLIPLHFEGKQPVMDMNGKMPENRENGTSAVQTCYGSDDFTRIYEKDSCFGFKSIWQFNHEPETGLIERHPERKAYRLYSDRVCQTPTQAVNSLTQRMCEPGCSAEITLDAEGMRPGDIAGMAALQYGFGFIGAAATDGGMDIVFLERDADNGEETVHIITKSASKRITFMVSADFTDRKDIAEFYYDDGTGMKKAAFTKKLLFRLEHFTGNRFANIYYSTRESGGFAEFSDFRFSDFGTSLKEEPGNA